MDTKAHNVNQPSGRNTQQDWRRRKFNFDRHLRLVQVKGALLLAKEAYAAGELSEDDMLARMQALLAELDEIGKQPEWFLTEDRVKNGWTSNARLAWLVWQKTDGKCTYCDTKLNPFERRAPNGFQIEHVIPRSRGGKDEPDNLVPACCACNGAKRTQTAEEFLQSTGRDAA